MIPATHLLLGAGQAPHEQMKAFLNNELKVKWDDVPSSTRSELGQYFVNANNIIARNMGNQDHPSTFKLPSSLAALIHGLQTVLSPLTDRSVCPMALWAGWGSSSRKTNIYLLA